MVRGRGLCSCITCLRFVYGRVSSCLSYAGVSMFHRRLLNLYIVASLSGTRTYTHICRDCLSHCTMDNAITDTDINTFTNILPPTLPPTQPPTLLPTPPSTLIHTLPTTMSPKLNNVLSLTLPNTLPPSFPPIRSHRISPTLDLTLAPTLPLAIPSLPPTLAPTIPHILAPTQTLYKSCSSTQIADYLNDEPMHFSLCKLHRCISYNG